MQGTKVLFLVGIGPICNKELIFIFDVFLFWVCYIEDRYNYYRINIRYTSVFGFLQCHLFKMLAVFWFRHRNIFCFVGIVLVLSTKSRIDGYNNKSAVVYII